jgi:hypothetical protein
VGALAGFEFFDFSLEPVGALLSVAGFEAPEFEVSGLPPRVELVGCEVS